MRMAVEQFLGEVSASDKDNTPTDPVCLSDTATANSWDLESADAWYS